MAKSLEERIAERVRQDGSNSRGAQRTAFLALKEEIVQALNAGWTVKDIWKTLRDEGGIIVSYQAFNAYVNRFIRTPATTEASAGKSNKPGQAAASGKAGFTINPAPKKEDIV